MYVLSRKSILRYIVIFIFASDRFSRDFRMRLHEKKDSCITMRANSLRFIWTQRTMARFHPQYCHRKNGRRWTLRIAVSSGWPINECFRW